MVIEEIERTLIEQGKKIVEVDKRSKSNEIRLNETEKQQTALIELVTSVKVMANDMSYMRKGIENLENDVSDVKNCQTNMKEEIDTVKNAPAERAQKRQNDWIDKIVIIIITGIVTYMLSQSGIR